MNRRLLTPEEYEEIRKSGSFERALEALAVYVRRITGPPPSGKALTSTERAQRRRALQRKDRNKQPKEQE